MTKPSFGAGKSSGFIGNLHFRWGASSPTTLRARTVSRGLALRGPAAHDWRFLNCHSNCDRGGSSRGDRTLAVGRVLASAPTARLRLHRALDSLGHQLGP